MKYKLIKSFPNSPALGSIMEWNYFTNKYFNLSCLQGIKEYSFSKEEVESNPEFFATILFTTEDGVDVYVCDNFYYIGDAKNICQTKCLFKGDGDFSKSRTFSTRKAAQKWIDEQNNRRFVEGEWVYFNDTYSYGIFRFKSIVEDVHSTDEGYQIGNTSGWIEEYVHSKRFVKNKHCTKAITSQIEEILTKVALHKGFKEGVKYQTLVNEKWYQTIQKHHHFQYYASRDQLSMQSNKNEPISNIYFQGKWAEIVEDVPEYVECIKEDVSIKPGNIYKVKSQNSWDGILNNVYYLEGFIAPYYCKNFKPSTKEAFDLQNPTKEVTITLDGDVVNTSHWGNNVKITYK